MNTVCKNCGHKKEKHPCDVFTDMACPCSSFCPEEKKIEEIKGKYISSHTKGSHSDIFGAAGDSERCDCLDEKEFYTEMDVIKHLPPISKKETEYHENLEKPDPIAEEISDLLGRAIKKLGKESDPIKNIVREMHLDFQIEIKKKWNGVWRYHDVSYFEDFIRTQFSIFAAKEVEEARESMITIYGDTAKEYFEKGKIEGAQEEKERILKEIDGYIEAMERLGGTGDTILAAKTIKNRIIQSPKK